MDRQKLIEQCQHMIKSIDDLEKINISMNRELIEGFILNREIARAALAALTDEPLGWIHEDELPEKYPYDAMFPYSKVNFVRMFPVFGPPAASQPPAYETLTRLYDLFGIGKRARTPAALICNVENTRRFAEYLHAIEREFFMVPGEPDEDYPDEEPDEECLVNCWGSTTEQYVEQFREALKRIIPPVASLVPDGWKLMPTTATRSMIKAGGTAARRYMEETGGNSPSVIYEAMLGAAPSSTSAEGK
ncbi:hypothetical protein [Sodalis ligni]|uniref:Uncharacterized protein n=1 Tax=Sodalis ligni TaxID=2697027 RepID=A0A4R1NIG1_9GAMM|nr:hypothetical protein [Sodalis ligni]TCL06849.1 hypothetical protein EZJ58_5146 [Sodalis ligni]